jgi:hypothetical protein
LFLKNLRAAAKYADAVPAGFYAWSTNIVLHFFNLMLIAAVGGHYEKLTFQLYS